MRNFGVSLNRLLNKQSIWDAITCMWCLCNVTMHNLDCLFSSLSMLVTKKTSQLCIIGSFAGGIHWWPLDTPQMGSTWWRHEMETFSALLAICAGNSPVPGEFPAQRPVTRSFDVFFDLHLNKRLSKQSWGWWFETLSRPLWHHCNECWAFPCYDTIVYVGDIILICRLVGPRSDILAQQTPLQCK